MTRRKGVNYKSSTKIFRGLAYRFGENCKFRFETVDESVQIVLGSGGVLGVVDVDKTGDLFRHVFELFFERYTPVGVGAWSTLDL